MFNPSRVPSMLRALEGAAHLVHLSALDLEPARLAASLQRRAVRLTDSPDRAAMLTAAGRLLKLAKDVPR